MPTNPQSVKSYVETILTSLGYTSVVNIKDVKADKHYAVGALGKSPTTMTFIMYNKANVAAVKAELKKFSIEAKMTSDRPNNFTIGIEAASKQVKTPQPQVVQQIITPTPEPPKAEPVIPVETPSTPPKELGIIETLLKNESIACDVILLEDQTEVSIQFHTKDDCDAATGLFNKYDIIHVVDDQTYAFMYVSLSLPDVLLNGDIKLESPEQKTRRHARENYNILKFELVRAKEFVWSAPHNRAPKPNEVFASFDAELGTCKLSFLSDTEKKLAAAAITTLGFNFGPPVNNEKAVIIVTLKKIIPPMQEVKSEVEFEKPTLEDLGEILKKNGTPHKYCNSSKAKKLQYIYFETNEDALKALACLQKVLPKAGCIVKRGAKCIQFPEEFVSKRLMPSYKKGKNKDHGETTNANPTVEPIVQPAPESAIPDLDENYLDLTRTYVSSLRAQVLQYAHHEAVQKAEAFHQIPKIIEVIKIPTTLLGNKIHFGTDGMLSIPIEVLLEYAK